MSLCLLVSISVSGVIKAFCLHIHYQQAKNKARFHKEWNKRALMSEERLNVTIHFRNHPDTYVTM